MLRRLFSLLLLSSAALASAAWSQPRDLRIGFQTAEVNVLLSYATQNGLFEQQGLNVTLVPFPAGPAMLPALASREIDMGWMGEFPSVTGYANGIELEVLMMERLDFTNIRLVASPSAGATLQDLKGKRIGATVGSSSHYHLLQALQQAGLSQSDVTVVNLSPANMPAAYSAGQIDAAMTWEPNIGAIEKEGGKVLATTRSLGMITGGVWVMQKSLAAERRETLLAFLRAWRQAQVDYAADPAKVRAAEASRLGMSPGDFDALVVRQSVSHPTLEEQLTADFMGEPGKELDSRLMKHLQGIGDFLAGQKRIEALPSDWRGLFNTSPIVEVLGR